MDLYHYSDPGQTQTSEMLDELIEREQKRVKAGINAAESSKSNFSASTTFSNTSFPPPTNTAPAYNLYGLDAEEEETQSYDEDDDDEVEINGSSQKENIGASRPKNDNGRINHALQNHVSKTPIAAGRPSPMKGNKKDNGNELYVVSNQGSSKKATTTTPYKPIPSSRYKPRPRPRSHSQDSFAQDPSEDLERRLLVQSEEFALPLEQIAKKAQLDHGNFSSGSPSSNMYFSRRIQQSPHMGKVLVASTPSQSNSDDSQFQKRGVPDPRQLSEQLEATQLVETQLADDAMNEDQEGYQSSEPSSSYGRILDGEQDFVPTQPTTQPTTLQLGPTPVIFVPSLAVGTTVSSVPRTTGPKSLLTTVRPENQWRYAQYQNLIPPAQQTQPHVPRAHALEETQPFNDDQLAPGPVPTSNIRGLHSRPHNFQSPVPLKDTSRRMQPQRASSPPVDSMDIVPDSEPSRLSEVVKKVSPGTSKHVSLKAKISETNSEHVVRRKETGQQSAEESDEDDTPLAVASMKRNAPPPKAAIAAATKSKGKEKMKDVLPADPTPRNTRLQAKSKTQPTRNKHSYEYGVVPSSMPEQDFSSKPRITRKASNIKSTSRSNKNGRRSANPDSGSSDEDGDHCSDQEDIEPAQEAVDDPGPSKKRKRGAVKPAATSKAKRQKKAVNKSTPVPGRQSRRSVYTSQKDGLPPTRVFALSKIRGYWYIATVYSLAPSATKYCDTYIVRFANGVQEVTSAHNMRQGRLRVGDEVIPAGYQRSFRVVEDMEEDADSVTLEINGQRRSAKILDIKMSCASMRRRWENRMVDEISLVFVVDPPKTFATPTPSKPIAVNQCGGSSSSSNQLLHKTGLIVTLNANKNSYIKEKGDVLQVVNNNGGQVVEDLGTIVMMDGRLSNNNHRWVIKKEDVGWNRDTDIERLFLVADECNQKPKYLLALALGIPCVSLAWLWDMVEGNADKEWASYLLPQGFSVHLGCRPSQQVDLDWGVSIEHLKDIMNNSVPSKVFKGKTILCVGNEMLPLPKAKKKLQDTGNAVPRIILAMGADEVEVVSATQFASQALHEYDYIVIRERRNYTHDMDLGTTVEWSWVKECLIASRIVPLEGQQEDFSQEA